MAKSKVGSAGWRFTNSLFFVLSFVPMLQWIPCFIMNGKLPKKKWLLMGFSNILILVMLLSGTIINGIIYDRNRVSYPKSPSLEDYMREDYLDYSYSEYEKFPEYKDYEKAVEEYHATDEYIAAKENNDQNSRRKRNVSLTLSLIFVMTYFVYLIIIFFVERYRYLRELSEYENRRGVYGALKASSNAYKDIDKIQPNKDISNNKSEKNNGGNNEGRSYRNANGAVDKAADMMQEHIDHTANKAVRDNRINVNTATEEELQSLPTISIIDAKKIIEYRNNNGNFSDLDDFFAAFNAKPHMIVKIQDQVYIEEPDNGHAGKSASASKNARRFDI